MGAIPACPLCQEVYFGDVRTSKHDSDCLIGQNDRLREALEEAIILLAVPIEVWEKLQERARSEGIKADHIVVNRQLIDRYAEAIGRWAPLVGEDNGEAVR